MKYLITREFVIMDYFSYTCCTIYCKIYNRKINEEEYIRYYRQGDRIVYKILDQPHCSKGPAFIRYNDNGTIDEINYYNHGRLHRIDGPAYIEYYKYGNYSAISYYKNGLLHRKDEPAFLSYHGNGNLECKAYYIDGTFHRLGGPAVQEYFRNGNISRERYYVNGQECAVYVYNQNGTFKWKYGLYTITN